FRPAVLQPFRLSHGKGKPGPQGGALKRTGLAAARIGKVTQSLALYPFGGGADLDAVRAGSARDRRVGRTARRMPREPIKAPLAKGGKRHSIRLQWPDQA